MKPTSLAVVAGALRKTTEHLAHETSCPSATVPLWSPLEWRIARAVTALQGIAGLLEASLQWRGPDEWHTFLVEQRHQCTLRERRMRDVLAQIDVAARRANVGLIPLKGAALLAMDLYSTGQRPMGDIDLLADKADAAHMHEILRSIGYALSFATRRHDVFEPVASPTCPGGFGEHINHPLKIELHVRIAETLPIKEREITTSLFPPAMQAGLNPYSSVAALMRHLLLHAGANMRARALRFIQLHDIALLAGRMRDEDWRELIDDATPRGPWWAFPPLVLAARYFPRAIPARVLAELQRACPALLKQVVRRQELTDVSWSNVRIQAFPGIEWSTSVIEAFKFARSRVSPSRTALAELKTATARDDLYKVVPWYGLSHSARILRWIVSRPPRVQTMHAVRGAFEA
jgi:Uncharacterised nucleotidyltransferase